jgi:hypothetical protein
MTANDDDFLARWSQRKTERSEATSGGPSQAGSSEIAVSEAGPSGVEPDSALERLLAGLPDLDAIDATTDVRDFLRKGVPAQLRAAALSRLWRVDPAIRDRWPDAVDYAEDYNAPGSILGWGPADAQETDLIAARLRGDPPIDERPGDASAAKPAHMAEPRAAAETSDQLESASQASKVAQVSNEETPRAERDDPTAPGVADERRPPRLGRSKHGGALPFEA